MKHRLHGTGPAWSRHHILDSFQTNVALKFTIILRDLITANHRKNGESKYDRKPYRANGVSNKVEISPSYCYLVLVTGILTFQVVCTQSFILTVIVKGRILQAIAFFKTTGYQKKIFQTWWSSVGIILLYTLSWFLSNLQKKDISSQTKLFRVGSIFRNKLSWFVTS